jgi:hypothetical protein
MNAIGLTSLSATTALASAQALGSSGSGAPISTAVCTTPAAGLPTPLHTQRQQFPERERVSPLSPNPPSGESRDHEARNHEHTERPFMIPRGHAPLALVRRCGLPLLLRLGQRPQARHDQARAHRVPAAAIGEDRKGGGEGEMIWSKVKASRLTTSDCPPITIRGFTWSVQGLTP